VLAGWGLGGLGARLPAVFYHPKRRSIGIGLDLANDPLALVAVERHETADEFVERQDPPPYGRSRYAWPWCLGRLYEGMR
jgi:hypothetical protein